MAEYPVIITDLRQNDVYLKPKEGCWKPDKNAKPSLESIGYIVGETLGEGLGSKVKKAYSKQHRTHVAIKIIQKRKLTEEVLRNFVPREISILQNLHHPGIVELLEVYETDHCFYMVFEYVPNGDVVDFVNELGRLTESDGRRLFQQLVNVVHHLHQNGICHRDIKLDNVLLDEFYNIKLIDFGFARYIKRNGQLQTNCGSYVYTAPEVLEGAIYSGIQSDIWSLGVCLYTMLCGRLPFRDDDVDILRYSMVEELKFYKHVSKDCKVLIRAMLNVDPKRRPSIDRIRKCKWMCRPLKSPGESSMSSMSVQKVLSTHQHPENFDPRAEHGFTCKQDQKEVRTNRVSEVLRSVAQSHSTGQSSINLTTLPIKKASSIAMVTGISGPVGRKISTQLGIGIDEESRRHNRCKALSAFTGTNQPSTGEAKASFGRTMKAMKTFKVAATAVRAVRRFRRSPLNTILKMPQEEAMAKMVQINQEKNEKEKTEVKRSTGSKVAAICIEERARERISRRHSEAALENAQRKCKEKQENFKHTVSHLLPSGE